jgi:hypothetical protein
LTELPPATWLEFRDATTDDLVGTLTVDPGTDSYTLTNAELVLLFGSETDFTVRAYHKRDAYLSRYFQTLSILKI